MRVIVTRVDGDGTTRRALVGIVGRDDVARWEELVGQAGLGVAPPYRPRPGEVVYHIRAAWGSDRPTADQQHGHGDEQHRQDKQPAALDPLEWPEPGGRLIAGPCRVAVLGEALEEGLMQRLAKGTRRSGRAELPEEVFRGLSGKGELAALGPPLAHDLRGTGQVRVAD